MAVTGRDKRIDLVTRAFRLHPCALATKDIRRGIAQKGHVGPM